MTPLSKSPISPKFISFVMEDSFTKEHPFQDHLLFPKEHPFQNTLPFPKDHHLSQNTFSLKKYFYFLEGYSFLSQKPPYQNNSYIFDQYSSIIDDSEKIISLLRSPIPRPTLHQTIFHQKNLFLKLIFSNQKDSFQKDPLNNSITLKENKILLRNNFQNSPISKTDFLKRLLEITISHKE